MPKKQKTHEEYVSELSLKNPNIEVIGTYIRARQPILHHCKIHDVYWNASPTNILQGKGCPKCMVEKSRKTRTRTNAEYIDLVNQINPNIEVIEKYKGNNIPILHKCKIDNHEWNALPSNIIQGHGCPKCAINNNTILQRKSHNDYVKQLFDINPDIEVVENYNGAKTPIKHYCKIHNYYWNVQPSVILQNKCGCPKCNFSKGEYNISKWLSSHNIEYIPQKSFDDCRNINPLPFDFYIPSKNSCIEYDGRQHFEIVDIFGGEEAYLETVKRDQIKNEYCKQNNIPLLRIPYYANIETELENFLLAS